MDGRHRRRPAGRRPGGLHRERAARSPCPQGNPGHVTGLADFAQARAHPRGLRAGRAVRRGGGRRCFAAAGRHARCPTPRRRTSRPRSPRCSSARSTPRWSTPPTCSAAGDKVEGIAFPEAEQAVNDYPIGAADGARRTRRPPGPSSTWCAPTPGSRRCSDAGFRTPSAVSRPRARRRPGCRCWSRPLLGVAFLVLPLVGLLVRAPWSRPRAAADRARASGEALRLSLLSRDAGHRRLAGARRAAGLGAGPRRASRGRVGAARAGHRAARAAAGGRRRRAVPGARPARASLGRWLYERFGITIPFTTTAVVIAETFVAMPFLVISVEGALRAADAPLRGRRGHARRRPVDDVPPGDPAARRAGHRRRRGALLGPGARRVRRDDHLRRQLPGHDADDAAGRLPGAAARPRGGDRAVAGAAGRLAGHAAAAPRPLAGPGGAGSRVSLVGTRSVSAAARSALDVDARGRRRRGARRPRPERRRQVHPAARARRAAAARRRRGSSSTATVWDDDGAARARRTGGRSAWCSRTTCCSRTSRSPTTWPSGCAPAASAGGRPRGGRRALAGPGRARRPRRPAARAALRRPGAAGGAGPRARGRAAGCCCSTSRCPRWMRAPGSPCGPSCAGTWPSSPAARCWSPTTRSTRWRWPTGSSSSRTAGVVQAGTPAEVSRHPRTDYVARLVGLSLLPGTGPRAGPSRLDGGGAVAVAEEASGPVFAAVRPESVALYLAPARRAAPATSGRPGWWGPPRTARRCAASWPARCPLIADVTATAFAELGLAPGAEVWATVKASEVAVYAR